MPTRLVFHFASGEALLSGVLMVLVGAGVASLARHRVARCVAYVLVIAGVLFMLLSATPTPVWMLSVWLALTGLWLVLELARWRKVPRLLIIARIAAALSAAAIAVLELPLLRLPKLPLVPHERLFVIGDSISAGIGGDQARAWPALLASRTGLDVVNLAQPGATLSTARSQADRIPADATLVVLEIGGNDLLKDSTSRAFRDDLDELLGHVVRPGRTVVMFELPLPPLFNAFGRAQRELSGKYDVYLIPRREFARVLAADGATLDGLHLSPAGHERMAALVARVLCEPTAVETDIGQ